MEFFAAGSENRVKGNSIFSPATQGNTLVGGISGVTLIYNGLLRRYSPLPQLPRKKNVA